MYSHICTKNKSTYTDVHIYKFEKERFYLSVGHAKKKYLNFLSIYLSIYLSCLSSISDFIIYLSIYLSIYHLLFVFLRRLPA